MAETFKVVLKFDGTECAGYSSIVESGGVSREGSIEGLRFEFEAATARERGSGIGSGRREFKPVLFTKRVDEASPLIAKALTTNQVVEATFDFFRNDPNSGVTLHYYTIQLTGGRISSIKLVSPDASVVSESTSLMAEEIGIVFHTVIWRNVEKGTEHQDEWGKS